MINILKGKDVVQVDAQEFHSLVGKSNRVVVDIGCGDAKFLLNEAKRNQDTFYIGIDSSINLMLPTARKLEKLKRKNDLKNILLIQAAAEDLPNELNAIADRLFINFPWGSLLEGIVNGNDVLLKNIRQICKDGAEIVIYLTYNPKFEPEFIEERQLPELTLKFLQNELKDKFSAFGVIVERIERIDTNEARKLTSWAKKILSQRDRVVYKLSCRVEG